MCHQIDQLKEEIKEKDVRMIEDRAFTAFHPGKLSAVEPHLMEVDGSDDFPSNKLVIFRFQPWIFRGVLGKSQKVILLVFVAEIELIITRWLVLRILFWIRWPIRDDTVDGWNLAPVDR